MSPARRPRRRRLESEEVGTPPKQLDHFAARRRLSECFAQPTAQLGRVRRAVIGGVALQAVDQPTPGSGHFVFERFDQQPADRGEVGRDIQASDARLVDQDIMQVRRSIAGRIGIRRQQVVENRHHGRNRDRGTRRLASLHQLAERARDGGWGPSFTPLRIDLRRFHAPPRWISGGPAKSVSTFLQDPTRETSTSYRVCARLSSSRFLPALLPHERLAPAPLSPAFPDLARSRGQLLSPVLDPRSCR